MLFNMPQLNKLELAFICNGELMTKCGHVGNGDVPVGIVLMCKSERVCGELSSLWKPYNSKFIHEVCASSEKRTRAITATRSGDLAGEENNVECFIIDRTIFFVFANSILPVPTDLSFVHYYYCCHGETLSIRHSSTKMVLDSKVTDFLMRWNSVVAGSSMTAAAMRILDLPVGFEPSDTDIFVKPDEDSESYFRSAIPFEIVETRPVSSYDFSIGTDECSFYVKVIFDCLDSNGRKFQLIVLSGDSFAKLSDHTIASSSDFTILTQTLSRKGDHLWFTIRNEEDLQDRNLRMNSSNASTICTRRERIEKWTNRGFSLVEEIPEDRIHTPPVLSHRVSSTVGARLRTDLKFTEYVNCRDCTIKCVANKKSGRNYISLIGCRGMTVFTHGEHPIFIDADSSTVELLLTPLKQDNYRVRSKNSVVICSDRTRVTTQDGLPLAYCEQVCGKKSVIKRDLVVPPYGAAYDKSWDGVRTCCREISGRRCNCLSHDNSGMCYRCTDVLKPTKSADRTCGNCNVTFFCSDATISAHLLRCKRGAVARRPVQGEAFCRVLLKTGELCGTASRLCNGKCDDCIAEATADEAFAAMHDAPSGHVYQPSWKGQKTCCRILKTTKQRCNAVVNGNYGVCGKCLGILKRNGNPIQ